MSDHVCHNICQLSVRRTHTSLLNMNFTGYLLLPSLSKTYGEVSIVRKSIAVYNFDDLVYFLVCDFVQFYKDEKN